MVLAWNLLVCSEFFASLICCFIYSIFMRNCDASMGCPGLGFVFVFVFAFVQISCVLDLSLCFATLICKHGTAYRGPKNLVQYGANG